MTFTRSQVAVLVGGCVESLAAIRSSVIKRQRTITPDAAGWGQYIDELRWSSGQWGLLGTSAGVQTLAICDGGVPNHDSLAVISRSRSLLIDDIAGDMPAVLETKRQKYDFENLMRLAFIAESHALGRTVGQPHRPPIVTHILDCTQGRHYWDAYSAVVGVDPGEGNVFMTALVLHALRNFEDPAGEFRAYRVWLATELTTSPLIRSRPHLLGLIGIALQSVVPDPEQPAAVTDALLLCEQEILKWRRDEDAIVVDRPAFEGYSLPHNRGTDYTFVNAEIIAAIFFLRQGSPMPARRFVLAVTDRVHRNVRRHGAFQGQPGMEPTVDQLWSARLLGLFVETHLSPGHLLVPRFGALPWARGSVLIALFGMAFAIALLTGNELVGVGALAAGALITVAFTYFFTADS
jgi:hypothetical protein